MTNKKKIYRPKTPVKTFFKVLGIIILILVFLAVFIFFSFQKYIVYSGNELKLEIPFLDLLYEDAALQPPSEPLLT